MSESYEWDTQENGEDRTARGTIVSGLDPQTDFGFVTRIQDENALLRMSSSQLMSGEVITRESILEMVHEAIRTHERREHGHDNR